ncbi:NAC domain containing protein 50-like [Populus alba x Populus x berolinensis]|uniref:NAC domain-containing protein n=1 Tax=Populus davidiana TaxID=266767 RepID=A0A6M2ELZ0_9ROSI|nr:NAC domain containing protein 50-like [Populus alba x Populus x berolinensis]KAJ6900722.1 NAC domain containing protein 50-like [Populus alba x Populus x berolinensis]
MGPETSSQEQQLRLALTTPAPPAPAPAKTTPVSTKTTALAPGFRFHPTDEELVIYYLKRKVSNKPFRFNAISEVDIYKNEPWDLADKSRLKSRDQEWYFFSPLDKKYGNGARMNRATGKGYWKATGKDREIRRECQLLAMKKTLVFHSGRAPGGLRTNWVMHEYRLIDEELERTGAMQIDSYVLCRVFHKNNIGPPTGNRYAPFIEEEWDDRGAALIPGEDAADEVVVTYDNGGEMHRTEQDSHSINKSPLGITEVPGDSQNALPVCKTESVEDCPPLCVLNTEAPLTLLQYKRRKHNNETGSNRSNASENSTRTSQDPCSSTTTTAATTSAEMMMATTSATTTAISALLEFSLMEPLEPKENPRVPPPALDAASLDSSMSPSCRKFINDLQSEIHKISVERETLKLEMMSAHAMINILQSRVDFLNKENEDLKRSVHAK